MTWYAISRLLIVVAAAVVLVAVGNNRVRSSSVFTVWDGDWYVSVAEHGYLPDHGVERPSVPPGADTSYDGAVAYFPAFPMIVAATHVVIPLPFNVLSALLALGFGATATVVVGRFARESAPEAADRSVLLFVFFPGAFVLSLAYAEGLLITAAGVCLLLLERRRWVLAGLAAAVASATRPNGLALAVACGVAALLAIRRDREWRAVVAPLLAPLGFLSFLGYLWWRTGVATYWFQTNAAFWHDSFGAWPELHVVLGGSHPDVSTGVGRAVLIVGLLVGLAFLAILVVLLFRARLPTPALAYALAYEGLAMVAQVLAPRPRLVLAAFPLIVGLAVALKGRFFTIALALSGVGMFVLFVFYGVTYLGGRPMIAP